jgi:hypothetical protein
MGLIAYGEILETWTSRGGLKAGGDCTRHILPAPVPLHILILYRYLC